MKRTPRSDLRKASMERASCKLVPFEIKSMTNHTTCGGKNGESSHFDESYMTELHPATLYVMHGFENNVTYFIPHTRVDIQGYSRKHGKGRYSGLQSQARKGTGQSHFSVMQSLAPGKSVHWW